MPVCRFSFYIFRFSLLKVSNPRIPARTPVAPIADGDDDLVAVRDDEPCLLRLRQRADLGPFVGRGVVADDFVRRAEAADLAAGHYDLAVVDEGGVFVVALRG